MVYRVYLDWLEGLPGKGRIPASFAVVGIAPSPKRPEHRRLEPFGARSYPVIRSLVEATGGDLYLTNVVKIPWSPGKEIPRRVVDAWLGILSRELELVQPQRILAVGTLPARLLCPDFYTMREDHGTFFWNREFDCWVIPTFHFSAAARDSSLSPYISRDLERFLHLPDPKPADYSILSEEEGLRELQKIPRGVTVTLDLETSGLELDAEIVQLGISVHSGKAMIFQKPSREFLISLGRLLLEKDAQLCGHNLMFDLQHLLFHTGWQWPRISRLQDTMLMAHVSGEEVLSLKHLTVTYTNRPGSRFGGSHRDPLYLAEDVLSTQELSEGEFWDRSAPILPVLHDWISIAASACLRGVYIDREKLQQVTQEAIQERERLQMQLDQYGVLNWNSPVQVAQKLTQMGVPLRLHSPGGSLSVSEKALLPFVEEYPVVRDLLAYREASKLISGFCETYQRLLDSQGLLHPRLNLTGSATGRFSCRDPNLQQVPRQGPLKLIFVPREEGGLYGLLDLSQAELRVAAYLSGDEVLAEVLCSEDPHRKIASWVFHKDESEITSTERKASKKVTFGLLYGGTPEGLAARSGLSVKDVMVVIQSFFRRFKGLSSWIRQQHRQMEETGFSTTPFGRKRDLRPLLLQGKVETARRRAVNTPIQSVASDIMLVIGQQMTRLILRRRLRSRILFGVHDSLVWEVAPGEGDSLAEIAQQAFLSLRDSPLGQMSLFSSLPITGELVLGPNWAATEETSDYYRPREIWFCSSLAGAPLLVERRQEVREDETG